MGEELALPDHSGRDAHEGDLFLPRREVAAQDARHGRDVGGGGPFVHADPQRRPVLAPDGHAAAQQLIGRRGGTAHADLEGVEERPVPGGQSTVGEFAGEGEGVAVHPPGDLPEPVRAVPHGEHGGHHGEQHLCRANVGGRLLPPDVLFPGLEREAVGDGAVGIPGDADETPRELACEPVRHRQVPRVRSAEAHRDPEPLRRASRDVGAEIPGGGDQRGRQQVGDDGDEGPGVVRSPHHVLEGVPVQDSPGRAGELHDDAEHAVEVSHAGGRVELDELDAHRGRAGGQDRPRLGEHVAVEEEP